jgi:hypothetical protein
LRRLFQAFAVAHGDIVGRARLDAQGDAHQGVAHGVGARGLGVQRQERRAAQPGRHGLQRLGGVHHPVVAGTHFRGRLLRRAKQAKLLTGSGLGLGNALRQGVKAQLAQQIQHLVAIENAPLGGLEIQTHVHVLHDGDQMLALEGGVAPLGQGLLSAGRRLTSSRWA